MNRSNLKFVTAALVGGACLMTATPSWGVDVELVAESFTKTVNGRQVLMWGYRLEGQQPGSATSPGPALTVPVGDNTLTIKLHNNLTVPTSLVIPNQNGFLRDAPPVKFTDGQGRQRAQSFVKEAAPNEVVTYRWNNVTNGTYLYHSGSRPALQVQMGLYGVMKKDFLAGRSKQAYSGVSYGSEATFIFGEIDYEVHDAIRDNTYGSTVKSMIHSLPDVYLLNGEPLQTGEISIVPSTVGPLQPALLRMINACYDERVPVVNGYHLSVVAEDGRKYAYPKTENAVNLPSMKTRDALLSATTGNYKFYDRRLLSSN